MKIREWHKTILISFLYILGIGLNFYAGRVLIPEYFPDRPMLPDILLQNIPYLEWGKYLHEAGPWILILIFLVLQIKNRFKNFNRYYLALAILLIMRGITIIFNPVQQSWLGYDDRLPELLANFTSDVNGYFFSGHTATQMILALSIGSMNRKWLIPSLFIMFVSVSGMMLSRSHYTMDVYAGAVSAMLIAYMLGILPFKAKA